MITITSAEKPVLDLLAGGPLSLAAACRCLNSSRRPTVDLLDALHMKGQAFAEGKPRAAKWCSINWWLVANGGLFWQIANKVGDKYRVPLWDREEIVSVARMAAFRCVPTFRPSGVKFSSYVYLAAIRDAERFRVAEQSKGAYVPQYLLQERFFVPTVNLESIRHKRRSDECKFAGDLPARTGEGSPPMDADIWAKVYAFLPHPLNILVVSHYRDGRTLRELGCDVLGGRCRERARQLLVRARELLRAKGSPLADYSDGEL